MRRSKEEKAESHGRIVEEAARRIREAGTESPGVAEIMQSAGMTHGGFYKHFASRDELIAEAAERACAAGSVRVSEMVDGAPDQWIALVAGYLSPEHRDDAGSGCAIAALGGDAARPGNVAREAFTAQFRRYVERVQELMPATDSPDTDRERAVAATAALVGSLMMARAVNDPTLADEILAAARRTLTSADCCAARRR